MAPPVRKPAPQSGSARRRLWRTAVLMLALAAIAGGGGALWLRQTRITQVRAALPPLPADTPRRKYARHGRNFLS